MKKVSVLMIVLTMLMSFAACKADDKSHSSATASDITDAELQQLIEQAEKEQANKGQ